MGAPIDDFMRNVSEPEEGEARDPVEQVIQKSTFGQLLNKQVSADNLKVRHALNMARKTINRMPPEVWSEAGYSPTEGVWLVREEARRYLAKAGVNRWRLDDLLDRYLPAEDPTEAGAYSPDGGFRMVDVAQQDMGVSYLVENYIPAEQSGLIVGDNQLGKSFLMAALAGAVAYGREWIGQPVEETGHSLFVLSEARSTFPTRLAGWLVHEGILPESFSAEELRDTLDGKIDIVDGKPLLTDPRLEEHLVTEIEERGTRLVVFDILSKLLGPEHHENDNKTASNVTTMLSNVAERTGATCILVHHIGHEEGRARGAHGWKDNVDFEFTVCGDNDENPFERGIPLVVKQTKIKEGHTPPALRFRGRDVHGETDGERWTTGMTDTLSPDAEDAFDPYSVENEIRQFVRDRPGATKADLYDALSFRQDRIRSEIDQMLAEGKIEDQGDDQRSALHLVPEAWPEEDRTLTADTEAPADLSDVTEEAEGEGDGE